VRNSAKVARARSSRPRSDARLPRQELHELLVPVLQRGELLELVLREAEPALQQRAGLVDDAARLGAHRGRVVDAALVHHAARERLLEAVDAASEERVAVADEPRIEALARGQGEDPRGRHAERLGGSDAPGDRSPPAPRPRSLPPSRNPSILLSATKHVASMPAIVPTCSFHNAWSWPVMPSAESMKTMAAASGTRWKESSGSEARVV
jgi:hypothetical protein